MEDVGVRRERSNKTAKETCLAYHIYYHANSSPFSSQILTKVNTVEKSSTVFFRMMGWCDV